MVEPYLNQIGGKVDNDTSLFTGGLNHYTDKAFLEANQMPYVVNMTMGKPPRMTTRAGRMSIAKYMENDQWASNIGSILDFWTYNEYQFYAIVNRNGIRKLVKIYRPYSGGLYSNDFVTADLIDVPNDAPYYFTLARTAVMDYLYISGQTFKIKVSIEQNPFDTEATRINDDHYGIVCAHKGRLFVANPNHNIITYSALYDYDNFDNQIVYQLTTETPGNQQGLDTSIIYIKEIDDVTYQSYKYNGTTWVTDEKIPVGSIAIDTTTGRSLPDYSIISGDFKVANGIGKIVSIKSFDDKLMIFCEHSMHCMYGDTPDPSMQNQYQLVDLNNNLGALSDRCIAIGGGRLFWLGDNMEVYEYTGSAINIISRPGTTRNSTLSVGGVSGLLDPVDVYQGQTLGASGSKFIATCDHLYINTWNANGGTFQKKYIFVFDTYNRIWWAEDGEFSAMGNFSDHSNKIILGKTNGDILISNVGNIYIGGFDTLYDFDKNELVDVEISYEFHTRVYGVDGVDMRKTLSNVWFQARATADVYIDDRWTSADDWDDIEPFKSELVNIGTLKNEYQPAVQKISYLPNTYEQQLCVVPKMYGERLNAFQIIVKGTGISEFYLMKREWRAR